MPNLARALARCSPTPLTYRTSVDRSAMAHLAPPDRSSKNTG